MGARAAKLRAGVLGVGLILQACQKQQGTEIVMGPSGQPQVVETTDNLQASPTLLSFEHFVQRTGCPQLVGRVVVENPKRDTTVTFVIEHVSGSQAVRPDSRTGTLGPGQRVTIEFTYDCSEIVLAYEQVVRFVPSDANGVLPGAINVIIRGSIHP